MGVAAVSFLNLLGQWNRGSIEGSRVIVCGLSPEWHDIESMPAFWSCEGKRVGGRI